MRQDILVMLSACGQVCVHFSSQRHTAVGSSNATHLQLTHVLRGQALNADISPRRARNALGRASNSITGDR